MTDKADNDALVRSRYLSDRFDWAAPGDQQEDVWLLRFCDNDVRDAMWTGPDAEAEAWVAWNRHAPGYNCYLFRLAALRTPRPEVDGADAQADAELVAAYPELAEHTDDPWFAVGFLREKFERSEAERAIWKERAMTMRIEPTRPQPDETETLRAEVARLRLELEVIQSLIEDEAYKITAGQSICKHIAALNEIHDTTIAALKGTDHGRG